MDTTIGNTDDDEMKTEPKISMHKLLQLERALDQI